MRNVISINALNNSICDLLGNIDDGSNAVVLEIKTDISKNPKLEINSRTVSIDADQFTYNIEESWYIGTGTLQFRIVDDDHTGDYFSIAKIGAVNGNLFLKQNSNFSYTLSIITQTGKSLTTDDIDSELSETSMNPVQNKVVKAKFDEVGLIRGRVIANWVSNGTTMTINVAYGINLLLGNSAGFVVMVLTTSIAVFQIYGDTSIKGKVNIQFAGTDKITFTTVAEFNYIALLSIYR